VLTLKERAYKRTHNKDGTPKYTEQELREIFDKSVWEVRLGIPAEHFEEILKYLLEGE
jgi:hypothetical protein